MAEIDTIAVSKTASSSSSPGSKQALISLSNKKDLAFVGNGLQELGCTIVSTGGTASALESAGVAVTKVEQLTKFPEMLDGRVKTLHPNIHGGILARRDQKHHIEALSTHGIATSPPQTVGLRSNTATTTAFETRFGPSDDLRNFRRVRKEIKKLEVKMPRIRDIPEWFDYVKEGGFPVFKARGKFPAVALAIVFGKVETRDFESIGHVCMDLFIEDEHRGNLNDLVKKNHVLLCDLRCFFHLKEWEDVGNDWKTIKVYCETKLPLRSWGIYVYKHETNIEDIQFLSQHPTSSLVRSLHALSEVGEAWF